MKNWFGAAAFATLLFTPLASAQEAPREIPFVLKEGHLIVMKGSVRNLNRPLNLVLDTGANLSVVSRRLVKKLNLKPISSPRWVQSFGRKRKANLVALHGVLVGPVVTPLVALSVNLPWPGIDAIVGLDVLRKQDFTIDYKSRVVRFGPRVHFESAVAFDQTPEGLVVPVKTRDRELALRVDTGASTIILNRAGKTCIVISNQKTRHAAGTSRYGTANLRHVRLGPSEWSRLQAKVLGFRKNKSATDGVLGLLPLKLQQVHFDFTHGILSWEG